MRTALIRKTDGRIDDLVMSLLEAMNDKEVDVQNAISISLMNIGEKRPLLVLSSCNFFLLNNSKLAQEQKFLLLNTMEKVIKSVIDMISEDLAAEIICQSFKELTSEKETSQCQLAASNIITALHCKFYHEVMSELLDKFQPKIVPNYFVVKTLEKIALRNASGTVPYMKVCLSTCLTILGIIKTSDMKCAFAKMLDSFCKAIVEYTSSDEIIPVTNITKEYFYEEINTAWNFLFETWLNSKDNQVRGAAVECLGSMCYLMPFNQLQEYLPKLFSTLFTLCRNHLETNAISEGLYHIIDASGLVEISLIEPFVDSVLEVLFHQACLPTDLSSLSSVKNHNEVHKSFSLLAKNFPDRVVSFILIKMELINEKSRIACLDVIHCLVNCAGENLKGKEICILSSLNMVTSDTNNMVKRKLVEVILGIAHHRYLELEGGLTLVNFIVNQCLLPPDQSKRIKRSSVEYMRNDILKSFCENGLLHISTSKLSTSNILWPYLLTFLISEFHTDACGVLCKAIANVATKKSENNDPDYYINFEREDRIPRPSAIFARLIVLLRYPCKGKKRGPYVLEALVSLCKLMRPNDLQWESHFRLKFQEMITGCLETDDNLWEEQLFKLLENCLEKEDDDWPTLCGEDFIRQVFLYSNYPDEKNFLLKCLGVACYKSSKIEFVIQAVDTLFKVTQHTKESEQEACAKAIGSVSISHAQMVVNKLNEIFKSVKTSFIITLFKEVIGDVSVNLKSTLILSYGYVTLYAPINFLHEHMDSLVMTIVNKNIHHAKNLAIRTTILKAMQLIGSSLSKHKEHTIISPSSLNKLFGYVKTLIEQESQATLTNSSRSLIMRASMALIDSVTVNPTYEMKQMFSLMVSRVVGLPQDLIIPSHSNCSVEEQKYSELLLTCLEDLKCYACILVTKNATPEMFLIIFDVLQSSIKSANDCERIRSLQIFVEVTKIFHSQMNFVLVNNMPTLGLVVATMVPRCSDHLVSVRLLALECISKLLMIDHHHKRNTSECKGDDVDRVSVLKNNIIKTGSETMFAAISDLSKLLNKYIKGDHLISYIEGLINGLSDLQTHCSSAASLALTNCIKTRGSELHSMIEKVFIVLVLKIQEIRHLQTKTSALRAIRFFTFHHFPKVISLLLEAPIPLSGLPNEIWRELGQDSHMLPSIMDHLMDLMSRSQPYEEMPNVKEKEKPIRRALALPLAIISAMTELMKFEDCYTIIIQNYPQMLTQMLSQVASMTSTKNPQPQPKKCLWSKSNNVTDDSVSTYPVHIALNGLKQFLNACKHEVLVNAINALEVWEMMALDQIHHLIEGLTIFANCLVQHNSDQLSKIIHSLSPVLTSLYQTQRIMAVTMYAEFIQTRCNEDFLIVDKLMNWLSGKLLDKDPLVRKLSIRGLCNVSACGQVMVQKYCSILLTALIGGLDEKDDIFSLEAMEGLIRLLDQLKEEDVQHVLISIALRIKPYFEQERTEMRSTAFKLFGVLTSFGSGKNKEPFLEQVFSNIVTMVLHCDDSCTDVCKSSLCSLKKIGPLLGSEKINKIIQRLNYNSHSCDYYFFLKELSKAIVADVTEKLNYFLMVNLTYFKSSCPKIRGNSAMFAGCLISCISNDTVFSDSKEKCCQALTKLLKDDCAQVRIRSAEAICLACSM